MKVTFLSNRFSYYAHRRTFSAEMSDLQIGRPDTITIVSSKTGKWVDFQFVGKLGEIEDFDGELVGYLYESDDGYKIHLFND